ncbi:cytochrome P450 [Natronorarus salvus]|uniref:cytochrome P450 n=1 Tax=Natronorarus salvus TaxID=3117733 RepID=UPI002F26031B
MQREIPQPPDPGILNALRFGSDPFRFLEAIQARFADLTEVPLPGRPPLVLVTNPSLAHDALSRPGAFERVPTQGSAARIAENGLVQSEGELWRQQRRIVGSAFTGRRVIRYADTVGERADELAGEWATPDVDGEQRDLHREMTALTIRVAAEVLLGERLGDDRPREFHDWMQAAGTEFEFSASTLKPGWLPDLSSGEFKRAAGGILELSEEIIERRRERLEREPDERGDMLALLLSAEDDPGVRYEENQIRDEVATFLIAGHETTALSLTYTLALLSWNPECRKLVRAEARAVLDGETPRHDHVSRLEYTDRVYREALRLYPPAWAVFRRAIEGTDLGEYSVEGGSAVIVPTWSIQRDGRYFERPEEFEPDRWERLNPDDYEPYLPFGSGPHKCVGRGFALSGATLALARLVHEFDVDVPEDALDDLSVSVTLRPKTGVPVTIRRADE